MTGLATPSPDERAPDEQAIYSFRPMAAADLALVRHWHGAPHVREWWDDDELTLASEDEPAMEQYIVACNGRPFACLQCYLQTAYPTNGLGMHPPGTRGIDLFIGEPDMVGCGHGSALARAFADRLLKGGTTRVLSDPHPANARAIRAYRKAGFRGDGEVDTPDGRVLLMIRDNGAAG
jgi:aminoglycoside 6'-N-acetyltransferase